MAAEDSRQVMTNWTLAGGKHLDYVKHFYVDGLSWNLAL
jgi:hypothetical protein